MSLPAWLSVAALCVLGMLGGSLIVAYSGFETRPPRGTTSVFVPAPEAYILSAILYAMSILALLALIRERTKSMQPAVVTIAIYVALAWSLVRLLRLS